MAGLSPPCVPTTSCAFPSARPGLAVGSVAVPEAVPGGGQGCRVPWVPPVSASGDKGWLWLLVLLGLLRCHCSTRFCCSLLHSGLQQPPELLCVISRTSPSPSPSSPTPPPPRLAQSPVPAPCSRLHPCPAPGAGEGEGVARERRCPAGHGCGEVEGRGRSSPLPS